MRAGISSDGSAARAALLSATHRVPALAAQLALVVAAVALVGLGLLPRTGCYRPVTVLSGSMRPAFAPGDMVVVTPEPSRDVRVGQVISYRIPVGDHHVQSHRVIKVIRRGDRVSVRTKGDANAAPDPWTATLDGPTAWRVRAVLPKLGWAIFWLRSPLMHELTVLLAPLLLALLCVLQIWSRPAEAPNAAWAWDVRDASGGGAETNSSDALSYAAGTTVTTKSWASTFSSTRFDDFDFSSGRPGGISVSSATFSFTFAATRAADTVCFYVEVRRASTNALLGTHGSSGTPSACTTGTALSAATVDVSAEVTTTDIANDLRIRLYATNGTNRPLTVDLAAASVTTPYATATLFQKRWDDEANAASTVALAPLVVTDATAYSTAGNFATTFSTTRYVKFTPSAAVPSGASITSAQ